MKTKSVLTAAVLIVSLPFQVHASGPVAELPPAKCEQDFKSFASWAADFRREALEAGISEETLAAAAPLIKYDLSIVQRDRKQGGFYKSFLEFSIPRAHGRIDRARRLMREHAELFKRIKEEFGVSGEVIMAFWGMETDFATKINQNLTPVITSMATLAYDCRRAAYFRQNLMDALRLVQNGDVEMDQMLGQWAGEMGGLQFTPSNFFQYGVDFDGDGKRDVVNSVADMLATAAKMFKDYGWRANEPYVMEVKVPEEMQWEQADLTVQNVKPMSFWVKEGVTKVSGEALPNSKLNTALMLPMGRLGPSFLAYENFRTLLIWNLSLNNALTAAYLASRIADVNVKPMSSGNGQPDVLTSAQLKELQTILAERGHEMGKIDGFLGTMTRTAVRKEQLRLGLPADGYPTAAFIDRLR